ncbi:tight junction-associated protein 1-like [Ruditapes philippinarum]|uniref:tight junction-associated protein 1-like n=1 Tax=Ruditapes philippinarum TaxID=129788 RepID=UPI00295BCFB4|nr:tight junction-associated protein 1-like [Ruditapes philippinarum]
MHKRQYSDNISMMKGPKQCGHCGCICDGNFTHTSHNLDLQQKIEELQSELLKSKARMSNLEQEYDNRLQATNYELLKLREEFVKLRDRYERLMESHKRMQKINDNLENKLLNVVNSTESEKTQLQKEMAALTSKIVDAKSLVCDLEEENERYRNDCNWAVQLLQCKPSNFVAQKLNALPIGLQERVKCHMTSEQIINMDNGNQEKTKLIHVPMQTFPPTAMVYSVPKQKDTSNGTSENQDVPTSLIAKVLTQPDTKRRPQRTYFCVKCREDYHFAHKETQTNCVKEVERGVKMAIKVHRKVNSFSQLPYMDT